MIRSLEMNYANGERHFCRLSLAGDGGWCDAIAKKLTNTSNWTEYIFLNGNASFLSNEIIFFFWGT